MLVKKINVASFLALELRSDVIEIHVLQDGKYEHIDDYHLRKFINLAIRYGEYIVEKFDVYWEDDFEYGTSYIENCEVLRLYVRKDIEND